MKFYIYISYRILSNQLLSDCFDNKLESYQEIVKFPDSFKKRRKLDKNYNNILSDLHINNDQKRLQKVLILILKFYARLNRMRFTYL